MHVFAAKEKLVESIRQFDIGHIDQTEDVIGVMNAIEKYSQGATKLHSFPWCNIECVSVHVKITII